MIVIIVVMIINYYLHSDKAVLLLIYRTRAQCTRVYESGTFLGAGGGRGG